MRLILSDPKYTDKYATYAAHTEDGEFVCRSHQSIFDGARVLLQRGYPPCTSLTVRHRGKSYDSFIPMEIGVLAKRTIWGGDRLREAEYRVREKN